jgi:hypothetical protein
MRGEESMKMFRDMLLYRRRLAMGFQVAMAMFAHTKGAATTSLKPPDPKPKSPMDQTAKYDFSKLLAMASNPGQLGQPDRRRDLASMTDAVWQLAEKSDSSTTEAAQADENFVPQPLSREEARLWLQAYNAGPYALLKYRGNVPYKETQNYAPRVFKYYMENLSNNDFEPYILQAAKKYGLDPQMIRAIMKTESDFKNSCVSGAGASGLMQVMPAVWSEIKKKYDLEWDYASGVFEPQKNIEVACAYLAWLRYDFLPRHFAEFEANPPAPLALVRDKDRGVPDRQGPRIETAVAAAGTLTSPAGMAGMAPQVAAAAKRIVQANRAAAAPAAAPKQVANAPAQAQTPAPKPGAAAKPAAASAQVAQNSSPASKVTVPPPTKKSDIVVEIASTSHGKNVSAQQRAGKTIVKVRNTGGSIKQPAVAKDADQQIASAGSLKMEKPNPRNLKKPSVAQADSRDEEKRS